MSLPTIPDHVEHRQWLTTLLNCRGLVLAPFRLCYVSQVMYTALGFLCFVSNDVVGSVHETNPSLSLLFSSPLGSHASMLSLLSFPLQSLFVSPLEFPQVLLHHYGHLPNANQSASGCPLLYWPWQLRKKSPLETVRWFRHIRCHSLRGCRTILVPLSNVLHVIHHLLQLT